MDIAMYNTKQNVQVMGDAVRWLFHMRQAALFSAVLFHVHVIELNCNIILPIL
jgi:hypothetical protein